MNNPTPTPTNPKPVLLGCGGCFLLVVLFLIFVAPHLPNAPGYSRDNSIVSEQEAQSIMLGMSRSDVESKIGKTFLSSGSTAVYNMPDNCILTVTYDGADNVKSVSADSRTQNLFSKGN